MRRSQATQWVIVVSHASAPPLRARTVPALCGGPLCVPLRFEVRCSHRHIGGQQSEALWAHGTAALLNGHSDVKPWQSGLESHFVALDKSFVLLVYQFSYLPKKKKSARCSGPPAISAPEAD